MLASDHEAVLTRLLASPKRAGFAPWHLRLVLRYIDERIGSDLRMNELVALTRLETSHFSRVFKRTFGQTFSSYIIDRRLERARAMMLETDAKLATIALACGFSDQSHFNRLFRRRSGVAPLQWRRTQRGAAAA